MVEAAARDRLLLIDDEPAFLLVAQSILRKKGYDVETAANGGAALAKISQSFFNAAVLDIGLPDFDGTELLCRILAQSPDTLAIMLTGRSSVQNAVHSLNRGAFAYLEKPLDPDTLLSVISRGLEKQRLVLENRRLLRELEQRNREAAILLTVSRAVSHSLDIDLILDSALQELSGSLGWTASYVFILEKDRLLLKRHHGLSDVLAGRLDSRQINGDFIGAAFRWSQPVVTDGEAAGRDAVPAAFSAEGYNHFACVPLVVAGQCIGVMGIASDSRQFDSRDVELLGAIGREIAIAIRNSQLYEEASSARALRELDSLRSELLANVSHELRTPLSVIKGYATSILQPDVQFDQGTLREFMETIDKEADRLNSLIEQLLTMSRLEAGALELRKERRRPEAVRDSIRDRLHNLATRHRLEIDWPDTLPDVNIDCERIAQVVTNLVDNAVKFSPEGSEIRIESRQRDGEIVIGVRDSGPGIPADSRENIFQRFYQLKDRPPGRRKGTGLGLCICRGIVEAHGGRIWVDGEAGEGAVFRFSLPACKEVQT